MKLIYIPLPDRNARLGILTAALRMVTFYDLVVLVFVWCLTLLSLLKMKRLLCRRKSTFVILLITPPALGLLMFSTRSPIRFIEHTTKVELI